jgi:hypothetical protein
MGRKLVLFLNKFCPDWIICTVNSLGNSGGLAAAWDSSKFDLTPLLVLWRNYYSPELAVGTTIDKLPQHIWPMSSQENFLEQS